MQEKKLTQEQEDEIIHEYVDSRIDLERKPVTQMELAKKYGISQSVISRIISNSDVLTRMRRRTKSDVAIAQAMAERAAPKIMAETIKDALKPRKDKLRYLNQNAARDVLDRAGVRAAKDEKPEVVVTFASGHMVKPAMPERKEEIEEE